MYATGELMEMEEGAAARTLPFAIAPTQDIYTAESGEKIVESEDHLYLSQAVIATPHEKGEEDYKEEEQMAPAQTPRQRRMLLQDESPSDSHGGDVEEKGRERLRGIQRAKERLMGNNVKMNTTEVINKMKQKLEEKCLLGIPLYRLELMEKVRPTLN